MKKTISIFFLVLFILQVNGCSIFAPGIAFPIHSSEYNNFIGKRYEVVSDIFIAKFNDEWGNYLLVPPQFKVDKVITKVPKGAIIIVDHVSRSEHFATGVNFSYIGRFETRGIFNGKFSLDFLMNWNKPSIGQKTQRKFEEEFAGMDPLYLKELKQ